MQIQKGGSLSTPALAPGSRREACTRVLWAYARLPVPCWVVFGGASSETTKPACTSGRLGSPFYGVCFWLKSKDTIRARSLTNVERFPQNGYMPQRGSTTYDVSANPDETAALVVGAMPDGRMLVVERWWKSRGVVWKHVTGQDPVATAYTELPFAKLSLPEPPWKA